MRRSLSATSRFLAEGSFEAECDVPDPVITGVCIFSEAPTAESLATAANAHVLQHERLWKVPKRNWFGSWKFVSPSADDKPAVDASELVWEETCSSKTDVMQRVHELCAQPLLLGGGNEKPQWEAVVLHNASNAQDASAGAEHAGFEVLLLRVHHVVGDGMGIAHAMSSLFTDASGSPIPPEEVTSMKRMSSSKNAGTPIARVQDRHDGAVHSSNGTQTAKSTPASSSANDAQQSSSATAVPSSKRKEEKEESTQGICSWLWMVFQDMWTAITLPLCRADTTLKAFTGSKPLKYSGKRVVVYCDALQLSKAKEVQHAAGVSFNDVMMSVTAGAIRRHALAHDKRATEVKHPRVRALLPFAFARDPANALRNAWCFVTGAMAFDVEENACSRLTTTHKLMKRLKHGALPSIMYCVQHYMLGSMPMAVVRKTNTDLFNKHSLVLSNVPGPQREVHVCSHKVQHMYFLFANLLPQVDVFTYAGVVYVNMLLDPEIVPEAHSLATYWREEMEELAESLNVDLPLSSWSKSRSLFASTDHTVTSMSGTCQADRKRSDRL